MTDLPQDNSARNYRLDGAYAVVGEMLEYFDGYRLATWAPLVAIVERERGNLHTPRPFCDWHEDRGDVLWWRIPICEPPYVGSPLCLGRKESHEITDGLSIVIDGVNAWPFGDDPRNLWWTPLPDAKRIEDQVPL